MRRWTISLIILIVGGLVLWFLDSRASLLEAQLNRRELNSNAVALRGQLEKSLLDRLQPVLSLQAFAEVRPTAPRAELDRFATLLYEHQTPLKALYIADRDGRVRWLYADTLAANWLYANTAHLLDHPEIAATMERAAAAGTLILSDPIAYPVDPPPEMQIGLGIYAIAPLMMGGEVDGFVIGLFYSDRLVRNALVGTRQDIYLVGVRDTSGRLFYGRATFPGAYDEDLIEVGAQRWLVAVGWRQPPPALPGNTRGLIWGMGSLIIAAALFSFNREMTQNMRLQQRLEESQALQSTTTSLVQNFTREEMLNVIADEALRLSNAEGCSVLLAERRRDGTTRLQVAVGRGLAASLIGEELPLDGSVAGRAFTENRTVFVNSPQQHTIYRGAELGIHSILCVPLTLKDEALGVISMINKKRGRFGGQDQRIIGLFANQASAAIQNARLFAAEQARRVIADRLREATAIIGSDLSLDVVLDRIMESLKAVVPYDSGSIQLMTAQRDKMLIIAVRGFSENYVGVTFPLDGSTPNSVVAQERRPVMISDVHGLRSFTNMPHIRSWLGLPLSVKGQVIGMLSLDRTTNDAFSEEEINLGTAFADQAAVAIEHARLFNQVEGQVHQLQALYEASLQLNLGLNLRDLLAQTLQVLEGVTGVQRAALFLLDEEEPVIQIAASYNISDEYVRRVNEARMTELGHIPGAGTAMHQGYADIIPDVRADSRFTPYRHSAAEEGYAALAAFPLVVQGRTVGALTLYFDTVTNLSPDEARLYDSFANLLALAVTNHSLFTQSRKVAALEERARLARELHDSVTQSLFSMTLTARTVSRLMTADTERAARALGQLQELAQGALAEMRALIFELRPAALQQEGLVNALRKHGDAVRARHHIAVEVESIGERRLSEDYEEALYRVAQEALNNIIKHAQAQRVTITLDLSGDPVTLTVVDDGRGFVLDSLPRTGMGLFTMRERVTPLGGDLTITSAPGAGTTIHAVVPIARDGVARSAAAD